MRIVLSRDEGLLNSEGYGAVKPVMLPWTSLLQASLHLSLRRVDSGYKLESANEIKQPSDVQPDAMQSWQITTTGQRLCGSL
jgi:hypothetical protein